MGHVSIGRPVIRVSETGSTMDLAAGLADRGASSGTVVLAGHQTAGRGRAGREWRDEPWSSILMSFLHVSSRPQSSLGLLAPAVGLAVAKAIEPWLAGAPSVKWPNDVLIGDRKIAGVLTSVRLRPDGCTRVICGIGLNVRNEPDTLPKTATSLVIESGREIDLQSVFDSLIEELSGIVTRFENGDDDRIAADLTDRLAWRGQPVAVADADRTHAGILDRIARDGSLILVDDRDSPLRIVAGDLTRGPRPNAMP